MWVYGGRSTHICPLFYHLCSRNSLKRTIGDIGLPVGDSLPDLVPLRKIQVWVGDDLQVKAILLPEFNLYLYTRGPQTNNGSIVANTRGPVLMNKSSEPEQGILRAGSLGVMVMGGPVQAHKREGVTGLCFKRAVGVQRSQLDHGRVQNKVGGCRITGECVE